MMQYRPGDASSSSTSVPLPLSPISDSSQTRALYADDVLQGESDPSRVQYLQLPPQLRSAPQERVQRLQRFYDLHLGESINARRLFNYEFLDTSGPSRVGTAAALDTLCIAQIATALNDAELMLVARSTYGKALRFLRMKIDSFQSERPDRSQLDDTIGAVHCLTACAWFDCIGADRLEWMRHTQALLRILENFGWKAINQDTVRTFYYNWKYRTFFDALSLRQKASFREPPSMPKDFYASTSFVTDYALEVPGLIWRSDRFFEAAKSKRIGPEIVLRLLTQLGLSTMKLKRWHLEWVRRFTPRASYHVVSTGTFQDFMLLSGEYFGVFPIAYDFCSAQHERDFRILCICLLNLDQAIINIHQAFPDYCFGR
ncbi:hypothetical protein LTR37_015475 [Vermiconidia calcicola]|uniref:Uncharacterized protein n=1 Tax=Vermiconidia calcicola TaxID=1690605 RepID=A0ACC3MQT5_9PEZI|nr:hypothetical protein LTR37_015475 [Vermiconidia calcicola]